MISLRLFLRRYARKHAGLLRPLKFLLVGATGMVVDLSVFLLLRQFVARMPARALAIWAAMTWNFLLNRRFTFSYARSSSVLRQYVLFCLSCLVGAAVNWSLTMALCFLVPFFDKHEAVAAFLGIVAGTAFNYVLSWKVAFARPRSSNPASTSQIGAGE
jgi:dolichol-phosphate mannosyltransferase